MIKMLTERGDSQLAGVFFSDFSLSYLGNKPATNKNKRPADQIRRSPLLTPAAAPSLRKVARGLLYMAEGLEEMDAVRRRPEQREFVREIRGVAEVEEEDEEEEEEVRGKGKGKEKARK